MGELLGGRSHWDLGRGRLVEGRDAIVALWYSAVAGMAAVVQMVHNGVVDAGAADPTTPRAVVHRRALPARRRHQQHPPGPLRGRLRRVDGVWRFTRRFMQPHYQGPPDLMATFTNARDALVARGVAADV